jgi:NAD(P)-dependent dehydrogenase (short-subunit alcohol dehydrogenase family)
VSSVVLVTGASRGIGRAAALAAATAGARLVLAAHTEAALEPVRAAVEARGAEALVLGADLGAPGAGAALVEATRRRFGGLDAVVNNAGVVDPVARLAEADEGRWRESLAINLLAPAGIVRHALDLLRERGGRVVNVSSGAALRPVGGWSAYCCGKAALNMLTRAIALEEPAVTAVALSPGMTDTDMQAVIRERGAEGMTAGDLERFVGAHREGRLVSAEDAGAAVAALALHASPDLSGEFVTLDDPRVRALVEILAGGAPAR